MVASVLERGAEQSSDLQWQAKVEKDKDGNAVGDPIMTGFGIVHCKSQCHTLLLADVTEEVFVETCVDRLVAFLAAVLERRDSSCFFCMS